MWDTYKLICPECYSDRGETWLRVDGGNIKQYCICGGELTPLKVHWAQQLPKDSRE